jgi:HK97 family phage major capsid protein
MNPEERIAQITEKIEALTNRADGIFSEVKEGKKDAEEAKALVETEIKPKLDVLSAERDAAIEAKKVEVLEGEVKSVKEALDELRTPAGPFAIGSVKDAEGKALESTDPYADGEHSYYVDVVNARQGDAEARERLTAGLAEAGWSLTSQGKALTEGVGAQGGYLVRPAIERQIVQARELDNVLRGLCSVLNVNTTSIQLDQIGYSTSAGWVAELAQKPEATNFTLATITANIFTAAGLATVSNQLLQDSNPAVDQLVTSNLSRRLVALEETAFLTGSGTGQPLGLLNTPGLSTTNLTVGGDPSTAGGLLDAILDAIGDVQAHWGQPSAILMHPRTWTRILKSRDAANHYTIAPPTGFGAGTDAQTQRTAYGPIAQTLFGVRVVLSNRVPTNLGTGTDESRVVVGDFREALILDRQGIAVDESPHVYFTSNQTVFRAETRVGFTAARSPQAFNVIGGTGLAGG